MSARSGGSAHVTEAGLSLPVYDYLSNAPDATTDVYTFRFGGSGGTIVAVVTVVYTDSNKTTISSVTRTPKLS